MSSLTGHESLTSLTLLLIRLGHTSLHRCSNSFQHHLTLSVPVEFWMDPLQREGLPGEGRKEDLGGFLQIDFGDGPKAIIKRGLGSRKAFVWDLETAELQPTGDIRSFRYDFSRWIPGPWLGGSSFREDGSAHGSLVTVIG